MEAHRRLLSGMAVLLLTIAGCREETLNPEGPPDSPRPRGAELAGLDARPLEKCRGIRFVRDVCPELVPRTDSKYVGRAVNFGPRFRTFDLAASAPYEGQPRRNRPPRFAHIVIQAGDLTSAFDFEWPPPPADRAPARLLLIRRKVPALLEEPTWGGREGVLVLMPPFELGGIHGDHLVFRWRDAGVDYLISLHAWDPFGEARATLQAVVEDLPPP
jgi:hypothetical protein